MIAGVLTHVPLEGGALLLVEPDGTRHHPRWPPGWRAAGTELLAPDGSVAARAGATVRVRGEPEPQAVTAAQLAPVLRVDEVLG